MKSLKILKLVQNNRKKTFEVLTRKGRYIFPFTQLQLKPTSTDPIVKLYIDPEIGREGFTYVLKSGKEDTIHIDWILDYNKDPDYERDMLLATLTSKSVAIIKKRKIKKRELARRLKTSPAHLYRLLDTTFYGKTIDQMIRLLRALDYHVEFILKDDFLKNFKKAA